MADRITTIGRDLLAVCAAALPAPPERQAFTWGTPTEPLEADQLAVGFVRTFRGVPGLEDPGPQYDNTERSLEYVVRLTRCYQTATGRGDTPVAVIAAAVDVLGDDTALLVAALYAWRPPTAHTTSGRGTAAERWVGPVTAVRPSGFAHGSTCLVQAAL